MGFDGYGWAPADEIPNSRVTAASSVSPVERINDFTSSSFLIRWRRRAHQVAAGAPVPDTDIASDQTMRRGGSVGACRHTVNASAHPSGPLATAYNPALRASPKR